jgi:hypothetical protein
MRCQRRIRSRSQCGRRGDELSFRKDKVRELYLLRHQCAKVGMRKLTLTQEGGHEQDYFMIGLDFAKDVTGT